MSWYLLDHPEKIDTPALLIYRDRVKKNIETMISIAGNPERLVPHVKTHKMEEIVRMQIEKGITRFKCATIAEAEMTARAGAKFVLLAYQLNVPKVDRYQELKKKYPQTEWASLVDNIDSARLLKEGQVYLDIDNGMHRTGISPEEAVELATQIKKIGGLSIRGLHVYDGHIREANFEERKVQVETGMESVRKLLKQIGPLEVITGGTPTFTVHALQRERLCSPGTCLLWDRGYGNILKEQPFLEAAVFMTRVISRPEPGLFTTDLGHKSVSAENPIDKRVFFLNLEGYEVVSQSEEHLVVRIEPGKEPPVGTVLYGVPYHVCPSVALHDEARVIEDGKEIAAWTVIARRRRIDI